MKFLASVALAAMLATVGIAQANPFLTVFPSLQLGPYAGIRGGWSSSSDPMLGANIGYDIGLLRGELDYDRLGFRQASSNVVTANGIFQLPLWSVTPYVMAGPGYSWRNAPGTTIDTSSWAQGTALYNLGGGLRYKLSRFAEIDMRYRYMQPFSVTPDIYHPFQKGDAYHVISTGVNVRF